MDGVVVPTSTPAEARTPEAAADEYRRGTLTVGFITLLFASNSPALHAALTSMEHAPPPLLLNALCGIAALLGLLWGGPLLGQTTALPSTLERDATDAVDAVSVRAGGELGLLKFCGTTANLYGLSLTSAAHGAFLIQLTTLIVPLAQGLQGVPIPRRVWAAIGLAVAGVGLFTQDPGAVPTAASAQGDALCVLAAIFYAAYDLRLYHWGKRVTPLRLITNKIGAQACLSLLALSFATSASPVFGGAAADAAAYAAAVTPDEAWLLALAVLWCGVVVNAIASFLQVGGQQAIGPARAQVLYASQPLWAALLAVSLLGETVGPEGVLGGAAFLLAVFLAATAPPPDPDCGEENCEI